ncbi:MAG: mechanosensitive ion channel [Gammaproteobacteria bacterium]|nr:mechanosensitive ion channel [Gammaproteobacteria bacterium]
MEKISNWIADLQFRLIEFNDPNNWWQLGIILLSLALAGLLTRLILRIANEHQLKEQGGFKKFTLRSIERVLFPLSALLLILIAGSIFHTLKLPVNLFHLVTPLLVSYAVIRMLVYILRKGFAQTPMLKAWENIISTTIWIIVALYLLGVLPAVINTLDSLGFKLGKVRITALSVISFILLVALLFTLAMWLSASIERRMHKTSYLSPSMRVGLSKFIKFFLIGLSFFIALDAVGIDLTALTVFGGALGVGLGFGLQRIASNFISGFLLLFDRSIKPGDVISIGNKFGWVEELRARYIVVRDRDGVDTLIPNENLITSEVINWSYSDRNVRLKIPVSISYGDDPHQALALMIEAARQHARVLSNPEPVGRLMEFGDNGIALELRIWINDPEKGVNNVRSDINLAIWRAFKDNKITIPFPQRDLHVKHLPPAQS